MDEKSKFAAMMGIGVLNLILILVIVAVVTQPMLAASTKKSGSTGTTGTSG